MSSGRSNMDSILLSKSKNDDRYADIVSLNTSTALFTTPPGNPSGGYSDFKSSTTYCFRWPEQKNCTEPLYKEFEHRFFSSSWEITTITLYIFYAICLVNNVTIVLVLSQKKYRLKIVPMTSIYLYMTNLVFVSLITFSKASIPFEESPYLDEDQYCKATHIVAGLLRSVTNWTFALLSLVHVSAIYLPSNFIHFRGDSRNSFWIFLIAVTIAVVSTLAFADFNSAEACAFKHLNICVAFLPVNFVVVNYIFPIGILVFSCASICYSMVDFEEMRLIKTNPYSSIHRVNKFILGSWGLFTLITLPKLIYVYLMQGTLVSLNCDYNMFYEEAMRHAIYTILNMLTFSLDSVLFMIVNATYRNELFKVCVKILHSFPCLPDRNSTSTGTGTCTQDDSRVSQVVSLTLPTTIPACKSTSNFSKLFSIACKKNSDIVSTITIKPGRSETSV